MQLYPIVALAHRTPKIQEKCIPPYLRNSFGKKNVSLTGHHQLHRSLDCSTGLKGHGHVKGFYQFFEKELWTTDINSLSMNQYIGNKEDRKGKWKNPPIHSHESTEQS